MVKFSQCATFAVLVGICASDPLPKLKFSRRQGPVCKGEMVECKLSFDHLEPFNSNIIFASEIKKSTDGKDQKLSVEKVVEMATVNDDKLLPEDKHFLDDVPRSAKLHNSLNLQAKLVSPTDFAAEFDCPGDNSCAVVWQQKMQAAHFEVQCTSKDTRETCAKPGANTVVVNFPEASMDDDKSPLGRYFVCVNTVKKEGDVPCSKVLKEDAGVKTRPIEEERIRLIGSGDSQRIHYKGS